MRVQMLIWFLIFSVGCVDPFETPSDPSNSNLLVVEGHIGDERTEVRLTRSANLDSLEIIPESDAQIFIESEGGSLSRMLNNLGDGSYAIAETLSFDERYRVRIETMDGNTYVSSFEPLLRTPEIEEAYPELDTASTLLEIRLSTRDPENKIKYYRWDYEETWEYTSVYSSQLEYVDGALIARTNERDITTCWMTEFSSNIILETTIALEQATVSDKLILDYTLSRNEKFRIGYSVLIKQYALTEKEFEFWTLLEKNSETFGTLFDPQPSQLITNVVCITNPEQLVLGYVGASSIVENRVDINRDDLPRGIPQFKFSLSECPLVNIPSSDQSAIASEFESGLIPLFFDFGVVVGAKPSCSDCRTRGGTTERPDFWN